MTTNEPRIRDLALRLIDAQEKYFEASTIAKRIYVEWMDACADLAKAMQTESAECVLADDRVVIFHGYDFDGEEADDMITTAFSVYTPWQDKETAE